MPNRHERRKAAVFERTITTPAEFQALDSICAWKGCTAIGDQQHGKPYLPKGWTALLLFWAEKAPNDFSDVMDSDMLRDCVLCPEHTAMLDNLLKPLPSRSLDQHEGGA